MGITEEAVFIRDVSWWPIALTIMVKNVYQRVAKVSDQEVVDAATIDASSARNHAGRAAFVDRNYCRKVFPIRTGLAAASLLIVGWILIIISMFIGLDEENRGLSCFILGLIAFIPGSYASFQLYGAWKGWKGNPNQLKMWFIGWPLGLLLSAISSVFGITGKLLLKLAHNERDREEELLDQLQYQVPAPAKTSTRNSPVVIPTNRGCTYFYCGLVSMLVLNPALGALAYCFATQSLLAPMAGLTIGWNTLLGPILLPHERLTTNDFVGAVLIFTGCVLVSVSGTHESPPLPVEQLAARFTAPSFLLYALVLLAVLSFLIHYAKHALHFTTTSRRAGVKSSPVSSPEQLSLMARVSLSVFAGVMSGQLFFLAAVMRIVHDDGARSRIWCFPATYICILGAVGTALFGLYLLNEALAVEDAVVVIYLYEASYIMAGAISGLCFFRDMDHLPAWHYVLYSLSLVLILLGIYIVAKRSLPEDEEFLLPLLAPPSAEDASVERIFQQASYYARRASYSGPGMRAIRSNRNDMESPERRRSMSTK